ncbi:MAG: hypothetical protein K2H49_02500 [Muribaculaceae bacterium]|nr:hypothetical protein [Muribaculaceae bacterium]
MCATGLAASKTYGYLNPANVEITDDIIEQNGDANAFTFASSATIGGGEYTLGEDEFLIIDSRKRYLYMTGTYNSFNVSESPNIIDGAINPEYIFTAKQLLDGTWKITNKAMEKYFQFSKKHNSWGAYQTEQAEAVMPTLYVITE